MTQVPLLKIKIETKLAAIRKSLDELKKIGNLSYEDFLKNPDHFAIAEHYLRRALEAIFDITAHIISRIPYSSGKRPANYKALALALGENKIIDEKFARETLTKMAGYRNRMVHFYDEISAGELHSIIKNQLSDIDYFARSIVELIKNPQAFNLTIE